MFQSITHLLPFILRILTIIFIFILIDIYTFQVVRTLCVSGRWYKPIRIIYWCFSLCFYIFIVLTFMGTFTTAPRVLMVVFITLFMSVIIAKLIMILPMLLEDIYRIFHKLITYIIPSKTAQASNENFLVSRKKFISQVSIGLGLTTFSGFVYGVVNGAHHYKLHKAKITLPNLPTAFNGIRIGHLSDIHSGSFWDKIAVQKGIDLLLSQKPDIVFFTGDIVNNLSTEMDEYITMFSQVKAPLGVYSILGNHDYGDYYHWEDKGTHALNAQHPNFSPLQQQNFEKMQRVHQKLGWKLLLNENTTITINNETIAIIGVENIGRGGRFKKYGNLAKAYQGVENYPVKLLLSHDPSHWNYQVTSHYPLIDVTFSGHTHGAQFGIETAGFKWSPIKYLYKQWAGLYNEGNQYLYVNRGFGYLGYPGRLGIRPEVAIITLNKTT